MVKPELAGPLGGSCGLLRVPGPCSPPLASGVASHKQVSSRGRMETMQLRPPGRRTPEPAQTWLGAGADERARIPRRDPLKCTRFTGLHSNRGFSPSGAFLRAGAGGEGRACWPLRLLLACDGAIDAQRGAVARRLPQETQFRWGGGRRLPKPSAGRARVWDTLEALRNTTLGGFRDNSKPGKG